MKHHNAFLLEYVSNARRDYIYIKDVVAGSSPAAATTDAV